MGLDKVKTIAKAFLSELPVDEKWYQDRLSACEVCEYNTKNIEKSKLKITDRIKIATHVCDNENHCTACGCCIERKCSVKSENCGKLSIGLDPNWLALEVPSFVDKKISIINETPDIGKVYVNSGFFVYDVGKVNTQKVSFVFRIHKEDGIDVKNYNTPCSCSVAEMKIIDKKTVEFKLEISTKTFESNVETTRNMTITYNLNDRIGTKNINLAFKIIKNDK